MGRAEELGLDLSDDTSEVKRIVENFLKRYDPSEDGGVTIEEVQDIIEKTFPRASYETVGRVMELLEDVSVDWEERDEDDEGDETYD